MMALARTEHTAHMPAGTWADFGDFLLVCCPRCGCRAVVEADGQAAVEFTCPNGACQWHDDVEFDGRPQAAPGGDGHG